MFSMGNKSMRVQAVLLILLSCIAISGCDNEAKNEQKFTGPVENVTICHSARLDTLILIANDRGFFKDNGVEVTLKQYSTGGRSIIKMH